MKTSEYEKAVKEFGTVIANGFTYALTEQADYTNRLLPPQYANYQDVQDGEEYQFEMSARAVSADGELVRVYWVFQNIKGEEAQELDAFDYRVADALELL